MAQVQWHCPVQARALTSFDTMMLHADSLPMNKLAAQQLIKRPATALPKVPL